MNRRKSAKEGSVDWYQTKTKGKLWFFVIDAPTETNKRAQIKRRGFASKNEAVHAKRAMMSLLERASAGGQTMLTVSDMFDDYLAAAAIDCQPHTIDGYRRTLGKHVTPYIGKVLLSELCRKDVEFLWAIKSDLAHSTKHYIAKIVRAAINRQIAVGVIKPTAVANARWPKEPEADVNTLSAEEAAEVMLATADTEWRDTVLFALYTGTRQRAMLSVRWSDLDLDWDTGTGRGKAVLQAKYAKSGRRQTVILPAELVRRLRERKLTQAYCERMAASWKSDGWVFPHPLKDGGWAGDVRDTRFTKRWTKFVKAYLSHIRTFVWHDLRHTFATTMLAEGANIADVSKALGHKSIATTLKYYLHWMPDTLERGVDAVAARYEGSLQTARRRNDKSKITSIR